MPSVRILVVEDFAPFRQFVCSMLGERPGLQVICEASDGLEAVQKAEELKPDLILLDIGLPTLNGIEAARRIRKLAPESKILFVSQESSPDVVQAALSLGALAYVVKAHAGSDLLAAVEAVCQGRQFVGRGLSSSNLPDSADAQIPGHNGALSSLAPRKGAMICSHGVQFCSDDGCFLKSFTSFIATALKAGDAVIVVATEPHRNSLFQRLQTRGLNLDAAIEEGSYIPLDVAHTLSTFMVNDLPDPARFLKATGDLLAAAAKSAKGKHRRVSACGECAPTLWAEGKSDAAIQLEHLWNEIAKTYEVNVLCGYVLNRFQQEEESHVYQKICAEHSVVRSP